MRKHFLNVTIAIFCGFILGAISLHIIETDVAKAYLKLFNSIFGSTKNIMNCFIYTTPFLLCALSFSISARGGIFNMGVEGEFIVSSVAACVTGIICSNLHPFFLIPFCVTNGIIASIILSNIVYILKTKFKMHEIFAMIITNYITLHFANFIISSKPIKSTIGSDTSKMIGENAIICFSRETITKYNLPTNMNFSFIVAVILCILIFLLFKYTTIGHNIENFGLNNESTIRCGISTNKTNYYSMTISAIIAGFAGSIYMISIGKRLSVLPAFEGYGFTGILISLFSNDNPLVIIISSLFIGSLKYAGRSLNIVNAPSQVIDLIISSIILIAAANFISSEKKNANNS